MPRCVCKCVCVCGFRFECEDATGTCCGGGLGAVEARVTPASLARVACVTRYAPVQKKHPSPMPRNHLK